MEYYGCNYENNMNHVSRAPYEDCPFEFNPCMRNSRQFCPAQRYYSPPFAIPNFKEVDEEELFG
ncbi:MULTISPECIES: hypothetical protein [Clostridium]|uniref:hypothetical protein n=1 Tax=Clostridium TaxID=1485 RepID=UPI00082451C6|nr:MULTISPECIES: hypothetical protein [Clostridium]PJI07138.1 hypothetical protein CUB90_04330 [Clostridium sp. CT7]